jgi:hypothetical protein
MRPISLPLPGARARHAVRASATLAALALLPCSFAAAQSAPATFASAVPTPAPVPEVGAPTLRIVDVAPDGRERGWIGADVRQAQGGLIVAVSRSALRIASPNARIVAVRAILADADTSRGWKVRAASAPVSAARLVGCVDGRLANVVRLDIPTDASGDALRGTRLAFELVGQVRAPGERRWSQVAERRIPGPVLGGVAP